MECTGTGIYAYKQLSSLLMLFLALSKDLPGIRLSALLQLPVSADYGHSPQCCRLCMQTFLAAEFFVSMATNSYQKKTIDGGESSPVMSRLQLVRKKGKDSSDPDLSRPSLSRVRCMHGREHTNWHTESDSTQSFSLHRITRKVLDNISVKSSSKSLERLCTEYSNDVGLACWVTRIR